jgi:hypothetical protein
MTNKNTIGSFTTLGPVSFLSDTQTLLGSVTNLGAWTLGASSGTQEHILNGGLLLKGTSPTTTRMSLPLTSTDQSNIPNNASNSYGIYIANGLTSTPVNNSTFRGIEVASHSSQTALRMHKPGVIEYNMGINSSNLLELGNSDPSLGGTSRGSLDGGGNLSVSSVSAAGGFYSFVGSISSLGNGATAGFGLTLNNGEVWQISATDTSGDYVLGIATRCGNFNYMNTIGGVNLSLNAATSPTISNTSGGTRTINVTCIRLQ